MHLFIILAAVLFVVSVVYDSDIFGGIVLIATVIGLHWLFSVQIPEYLMLSWQQWAILVVLYFLIGVAWSLFRFYTAYKRAIARLYQQYNSSTTKKTHDEIWASIRRDAPTPSSMAGDITTWIGFWPVSIITYIMGDLLHDLTVKVYEMLKSLYEKIASNIINSMFNRTKP